MNKAIILDCETSGLPPTGEACEIAYFPIFMDILYNEAHTLGRYDFKTIALFSKISELETFHQTFMPKGEFHPRASEVNGFTKENLKGSPCISTFSFPPTVEYMIGHNIIFDHAILKKPKVKLICTKELAIKYLTNRSGRGTKGVNTLTGLIERYYPEEAKELIANAHSALQDCKLTYLILLKILEVAPELDSFEKLAEQCTQPNGTKQGDNLPSSIKQDPYTKEYSFTFGRYKGLAFSRINSVELVKYLTWIIEVSSLSEDLRAFLKQFLKDNK
jgi:DNA polymerase III epsilon subunit-like protein